MRAKPRLFTLFLIVFAAGCGAAPVLEDASIGQKVAETFLAQIRDGQYDAAWQSTTAEFKSDEGRESFARDVKSRPAFRQPLTLVKYEVTELNGLKRGQCTYESPPGGKVPPTTVRLVIAHDAGEWRVDGMFVE